MTSPEFVFYLACLFLGKVAQMTNLKSSSVHQERHFVSANVGDDVTLRCFYEGDESAWLYWYKQPLGQKPRLISNFYIHDQNPEFNAEFNNKTRFTLDTGKSKNHLKIFNLHISDSATYYCAVSISFEFEFAEGTIFSVKGSGLNVPALVHQSESESVQPGDSVTLNCTVHTGTCDGEHSVYWFKNSEESHPGLIYIHGGRNDQCERKPDTQTHTCVYNLPMKSLNLSHAGTYHCAVASCGHILFGNGTKLDFEAQMTNLKMSLSVRQEKHFVSANVGDDVTLQCLYEGDDKARLYWYKQPLGQKPRLISTFDVYHTRTTFYNEFKNNRRFTLGIDNRTNYLKIFDLNISDTATYYCANSSTFVMDFAEGTVVSVKGSGLNVQALVHQSESESVQSGDSVTLNCTVHTGTCDGEHSVYWFRNSEESQPGLIYTHGGRNDSCEREDNTQTHTCVYNLQMQNLNLSHAGTYYCAVASCGHILFGNGTKLDVEHETDSLDLVYFLSGALTFTTILVVLLVFTVCRMIKRNSSQCIGSQARRSAPSTTNAKDYQNAVNLYLAASLVSLHKRSRSPKDPTWSECVYYSVKQ